jgi:hypothetical protein
VPFTFGSQAEKATPCQSSHDSFRLIVRHVSPLPLPGRSQGAKPGGGTVWSPRSRVTTRLACGTGFHGTQNSCRVRFCSDALAGGGAEGKGLGGVVLHRRAWRSAVGSRGNRRGVRTRSDSLPKTVTPSKTGLRVAPEGSAASPHQTFDLVNEVARAAIVSLPVSGRLDSGGWRA